MAATAFAVRGGLGEIGIVLTEQLLHVEPSETAHTQASNVADREAILFPPKLRQFE
jgi:hypothetical protein